MARPARLWRHFTYLGYSIRMYRDGMAGRIEIDLAIGHAAIGYTTGPGRHSAFQTHERAIGFAFGWVEGMVEAGAIGAPPDSPKLVLFEGGKT